MRQPVAVAFNARAQKDFPLLTASSVSGRLTERKGADVVPVVDAAIRLEPGGLYAYSDASGDFNISNIPRGSYRLAIVPETLDRSLRIVAAPDRAVEIVQAGRQLKGFEFVLEHVEAPPVIERLPASKITVDPALR